MRRPRDPLAGRQGGRRARAVVIRRARDRPALPAPAPAPLAPLESLLAPEGRSALEALIRRLGARAPLLVSALGAGWRRPDGAPPDDADLRALLDAHGLLRAFQHRERDAALHALRAAGGVLGRAAASLGMAAAHLEELFRRTGAGAEAEALREERRRDLRRRATLTERAQLLLDDEERLTDLGLLAEFEADLRRRIPEHLRALKAAGAGPGAAALGRSLSLGRDASERLSRRLGLALAGAAPPPGPERAPSARTPRLPREGRPTGRRRPRHL